MGGMWEILGCDKAATKNVEGHCIHYGFVLKDQGRRRNILKLWRNCITKWKETFWPYIIYGKFYKKMKDKF